jgi:hypothetical protein
MDIIDLIKIISLWALKQQKIKQSFIAYVNRSIKIN